MSKRRSRPRVVVIPRSDPDPILAEVFRKVSKVKVAAACGVSKAAVSQWKRVPDDHIRTIAELTGISLKRIRPDLYDSKYERPVAEAAAA